MGLDIVELVMRCEEVFEIELHDEDMEQVKTVGDLYIAICKGLGLVPDPNPLSADGMNRLPHGTLNLAKIDWKSEDVWSTLVVVFVEQLAVDYDQVTPSASIAEDLRVD